MLCPFPSAAPLPARPVPPGARAGAGGGGGPAGRERGAAAAGGCRGRAGTARASPRSPRAASLPPSGSGEEQEPAGSPAGSGRDEQLEAPAAAGSPVRRMGAVPARPRTGDSALLLLLLLLLLLSVVVIILTEWDPVGVQAPSSLRARAQHAAHEDKTPELSRSVKTDQVSEDALVQMKSEAASPGRLVNKLHGCFSGCAAKDL